jgi:hypothetical protein
MNGLVYGTTALQLRLFDVGVADKADPYAEIHPSK